jgi:hypothetical protein
MHSIRNITLALLAAAASFFSTYAAGSSGGTTPLPSSPRFVPDITPMNVKIHPQPITPFDTLSVAPLTYLHEQCIDFYVDPKLEMAGSTLRVVYDQLQDSSQCPPAEMPRPYVPAFEIGRFPPGSYSVQIHLKRRDGFTELLKNHNFVVPQHHSRASGLPRENYSGLWTNWPVGILPFNQGALHITHIGYYLAGSALIYDEKGQPVWYFFTPDLNSADNNPELTDPNVAAFGRAWFRGAPYTTEGGTRTFFSPYQLYRVEIYKFTGPAANPQEAKAKAVLQGKATLAFFRTSFVNVVPEGSQSSILTFHRTDSQQY